MGYRDGAYRRSRHPGSPFGDLENAIGAEHRQRHDSNAGRHVASSASTVRPPLAPALPRGLQVVFFFDTPGLRLLLCRLHGRFRRRLQVSLGHLASGPLHRYLHRGFLGLLPSR